MGKGVHIDGDADQRRTSERGNAAAETTHANGTVVLIAPNTSVRSLDFSLLLGGEELVNAWTGTQLKEAQREVLRLRLQGKKVHSEFAI